jgi:hypothetical protein
LQTSLQAQLLHCFSGTFALDLCLLLLLGLLEAMCIPVSAQSTKELEVISPGAAVMLLVLLHWDLVVHGTCFTLGQCEVHQLGVKSIVQALFAD